LASYSLLISDTRTVQQANMADTDSLCQWSRA